MAKAFDIVGEEYVHAILESFGGLRPMAKSIGVGVSTVQGWKQRAKIPAGRLQDIADAATKQNISLPDYFEKALNGDSTIEDAPSYRMVEDDSMNVEAISAREELEEPAFEVSSEYHGQDHTDAETGLTQEQMDILNDADSDVFHSRQSGPPKPTVKSSDDGHSGHDKSSLPKSSLAHWALLLSAIALIAVVTRPIWSENIDSKLASRIGGGHGDEHGGEHSDEGDYAKQIHELEKRLTEVEQASARLALLNYNLTNAGEDSPHGQASSAGVGMSAAEFKKLQSLGIDLELLKKDALATQTQISSISGLANQLDENTRLISGRLEKIENSSGRLFERNFDRSIGVLYSLERLDSQIRDGLSFKQQFEEFNDITKNFNYRDNFIEDLEILAQYSETGIVTLPILVQQYQDNLYPLLVRKSDQENKSWQEQVTVRLRGLIHFRRQKNADNLPPLLKAEYLLNQGDLREAIGFAEQDITLHGEGTDMVLWLEDAKARRDSLQAINNLRSNIGSEIIKSLRDFKTGK